MFVLGGHEVSAALLNALCAGDRVANLEALPHCCVEQREVLPR